MPIFDLQSIEHLTGVGTVFHEPSMPSTSDVAKTKLLKDDSIRMPLLVLCEQQTAGRGQPGKTWESNTRSLTFTWCIDAESVPAANHGLLPLIAGVSVCEAIESIGVANAKLKWPNDVLIKRKKVSGILVEKIASRGQAWFLIGIGINVNQSAVEAEAFDCSPSRFPPASLSWFAGRDFQLQNLLGTVIPCLHENVICNQDWQQAVEARFDFLGQQVEVKKPDGALAIGTFLGVDETGRMRLDCNDETVLITSGQLT